MVGWCSRLGSDLNSEKRVQPKVWNCGTVVQNAMWNIDAKPAMGGHIEVRCIVRLFMVMVMVKLLVMTSLA